MISLQSLCMRQRTSRAAHAASMAGSGPTTDSQSGQVVSMGNTTSNQLNVSTNKYVRIYQDRKFNPPSKQGEARKQPPPVRPEYNFPVGPSHSTAGEGLDRLDNFSQPKCLGLHLRRGHLLKSRE